jgi:23S rRNA pseudouridine1911/1915/1917 synthase
MTTTPPGFGILLEDDDVLAVNKPTGITTQAPKPFDSLEARIRIYLAGDSQSPDDVYLGIPHRLDRPVSGVIIFAKTRRAARQLSKQFERRRVHKIYWTAVERVVEPLDGTWIDYLHKFHGQPKTAVVEASHVNSQEAILHYRTRGFHQAGTLLEIELETGRTHQIRVQTSTRGHPVLGDEMYGARIAFGPHEEDERLRLIALHARSLSFFHPITKEPITLEAPLGESWSALQLTLRDEDATFDQPPALPAG